MPYEPSRTGAERLRDRGNDAIPEYGMATASALAEVARLLADSELPHSDVEQHFDDFVLARSGESVVGVAGIERHGRVGLLRSVCVRRDFRRRGIAGRLCDLIESHARDIGIDELYLLTTTAEHFFAKRGFSPCARDLAPPSIRRTQEFRSLCPSSAVCMRRPVAAVTSAGSSAVALDGCGPGRAG